MNLHGLAAGAIGAVNPFAQVTLKLPSATGYTTNPDGSRAPQYAASTTVSAQIQALSGKDLRQIESLNLQGTLKKMYFYGEVDAIVRSTRGGGAVVTLPDNSVWLVTQVLEQWPDWCSVVVTLQGAS